MNLLVTGNPGDLVLYNSPTASEYSFETGYEVIFYIRLLISAISITPELFKI